MNFKDFHDKAIQLSFTKVLGSIGADVLNGGGGADRDGYLSSLEDKDQGSKDFDERDIDVQDVGGMDDQKGGATAKDKITNADDEQGDITSQLMLENYYNSQDNVIKWLTRCFVFFLFLLSLGIITIFIITKNTYAQASSFLEVQSISNLIRQDYILVTKEIQNIYLILEGAQGFQEIREKEDQMIDFSKEQIEILFENLRKEYNHMLTLSLDPVTKQIFDETLFEQRLEIDSTITEKVILIEALNEVIVKSFDAQMKDLVLGERKLKESEDYFVRNYEDFANVMEVLVTNLYT